MIPADVTIIIPGQQTMMTRTIVRSIPSTMSKPAKLEEDNGNPSDPMEDRVLTASPTRTLETTILAMA